eukprot:TRINITY_DN4430_c0_g1::TRINITY_DN4430_c0_g1_i1::g.7299::m.7299 TRINITY_DN4430_c0_g1::TRINITY_DN4430_c0_g1_i1::g.7299  ORF type:complete len:470 (-),score=90.81,sp/Q8C3P7/MTA70_MOUSE/24.51/5e-07,MT-A70/PF05063.9/8.8e-11 TRINITY_DN4430_c0_g1_i1:275-1567(-)
MPSSALYLGYVEDDETDEMIMKKFEALEKLQKEAMKSEETSKDSDNILTLEQQEELFKETSTFTVKTALHGNQVLNDDAERWQFDVIGEEDELKFDSEEELWDGEFTDWVEERRKVKKATSQRSTAAAAAASRARLRDKLRSLDPTKMHTHTLMRLMALRRKKKVDQFEAKWTRMPNPMPATWATFVRNGPQQAAERARLEAHPDQWRHIQADLMASDLSSVLLQHTSQKFLCALVNPPWKCERCKVAPEHQVTIADIARLKLEKAIPYGFIFMWVEREHTMDVFDFMTSKGFNYVESIAWIRTSGCRKPLIGGGRFLNTAQTIMYIFRKPEPQGERIELQHQRNADVLQAALCYDKHMHERKPRAIYNVIETLLPQLTEESRLLEVWANPDTRRIPWTSISHTFGQATLASSASASSTIASSHQSTATS